MTTLANASQEVPIAWMTNPLVCSASLSVDAVMVTFWAVP